MTEGIAVRWSGSSYLEDVPTPQQLVGVSHQTERETSSPSPESISQDRVQEIAAGTGLIATKQVAVAA